MVEAQHASKSAGMSELLYTHPLEKLMQRLLIEESLSINISDITEHHENKHIGSQIEQKKIRLSTTGLNDL